MCSTSSFRIAAKKTIREHDLKHSVYISRIAYLNGALLQSNNTHTTVHHQPILEWFHNFRQLFRAVVGFENGTVRHVMVVSSDKMEDEFGVYN